MTLKEQFGSNLRFYRGRAGLSQERCAVLAHLHRTEISLIERGKRGPNIATLVKLASVLDVSPAELLAGIEWKDGAYVIGGDPELPSGLQRFMHPLGQRAMPPLD